MMDCDKPLLEVIERHEAGRALRRLRWDAAVQQARTDYALRHIGRPVDPAVVAEETAAMLRLVIAGRIYATLAGVFETTESIERALDVCLYVVRGGT
jgi:predicted TIM-barrel fold metal-dependent hydrolase